MAWVSSRKEAQEASTSQAVSGGQDSLSSKSVSARRTRPRCRHLSVAAEKDSQVKRVSTLGQDDLSNSEACSYLKDETVEDAQQKVLA